MFHFYMDESGNPYLTSETLLGGHRFFVLLAIGIAPGDAYDIENRVLGAIRSYFPDLPPGEVYIRSVNIRTKVFPFDRVDPDQLRLFTDELYQILLASPATLFAFVLDKYAHKDQYAYPCDPYEEGFRQLLERFAMFLNRRPDLGDGAIYLDTRDAKHGGRNDKRLKMVHALVSKHGTRWVRQVDFQRLTLEPKFIDSRTSRLIQLADLCAYNMYAAWTYKKPQYSYYQRMLPKFDRAPRTGTILGAGIKLFPKALEQRTASYCDG